MSLVSVSATPVGAQWSTRGGLLINRPSAAVELFRVENPRRGDCLRLSIDGAEFWLSDESPEHENFSPESLGGSTARMILTMAEPDQCSRRPLQPGHG